MLVFPNAKINLGLQVLSKREDGYHNIHSCLYPISWCDALEVLPSTQFSFRSTGIPIDGNLKANSCVKAYNLLKDNYDLPPIQIHLHKVIPMGAGLGGGSADGAFMLKLLNELFNLKLDETNLIHYASLLGSDCIFFIKNKPIGVSGRGERLCNSSVSLKGKWIVVIYPAIHSSTKEAYEGLDLSEKKKRANVIDLLEEQPITEWKDCIQNDFEKTIFPKYPILSEIKNQLYKMNAIYASMSGSGSSMYGIFDEKKDLEKISFSSLDDRCVKYTVWQDMLK